MMEKTAFREHIVQDLGVCPQGAEIESANANDNSADGKTFDADRVSPNVGNLEWEF